MEILTFNEYKTILIDIKRNSWNKSGVSTIPDFLIAQWYTQFLKYEHDWIYYFNHIFRPNFKNNKPFRVILFESGPGGICFPHPNYMFLSEMLDEYNLNAHMDNYLNRVIRSVGLNPKNHKTRRDKLLELASNSILIIDLFPTHGIGLNTVSRKTLWNEHNRVAKKKVESIFNILKETAERGYAPSEVYNFLAADTPSLSKVFSINSSSNILISLLSQ